MSTDKEQIFSLKTQFNIDITINDNMSLKFKSVFGSDKMTHRHPVMND